MIIIELIYNLSILISFSIISGFIDKRWERKTISGKILQGFLFGITSIIGMMNPFVLTKGIIFDGRSIVISLCTLFFGPLSGGIASVIAIFYRIQYGGGGALMGTLVILSSFLLGYRFFIKLRTNPASGLNIINLYIFGILVHVVMLVLVLCLPAKNIIETYHVITFTVLGIYPLVTVLIGKILKDQADNAIYIDELSKKESLFRVTLYSIGDAVITTDTKGRIKHMNYMAEQLTGWKEDEIRDERIEKVFKLINENSRNEIKNPVYKVLEEKNIIGLANNTLLLSRYGNETPIADSAAPIKDESDTIIGVVLVFRNQSEERLRHKIFMESQQRFSKFMENLPGSVLIKDQELRPIYANQKFKELFPYEQWEDKRPQETFPPEIAEEMIKHDIKALTEGYIHYEETWKDVNGKEHILDTHKFRIELPDSQANVGAIIMDITERKLAEEKLRNNESRMRMIVEGTPYLFFYAQDTDAKITYISPSVEKITGYSVNDWLNQSHWFVTNNPINELAKEKTHAHLRGEITNSSILVEVEHADKYPILLEIFESPIFADGKVVGLQGVAHDITLQKKTEQALRESEEKYRLISNVASDYMFTSYLREDGQSELTWVGGAFEKITGYNLKEYVEAGGWNARLYPEDIPVDLNDMKQLSENKQIETEIRTITKDGKIVWVRVFAHPIWDDKKKKLIGIYGAVQNITERKKAEEVLKESEEKFHSLFENSPNAIFISDPETLTILDCNINACRMNGYEQNELIGKSLNMLHPDEIARTLTDPELHKNQIKLLQQDQVVTVETRHKRKDGTVFPIETSYSLITIGGKKLTMGIDRDITERKLAEEKLRESEERYRLLVNHSPDAIGVYVENKIVFVNNAAVKLLGAESKEEILGKSPLDFVHPDSIALVLERSQRMMKGEFVPVAEEKFIQLNGNIIDVEVGAMPLLYNDQRAVQLVIRDITERKIVEEELKASEERYRNLFNNHSAIKLLIDLETGKIIDANKAALNFYGWPFEEMKQMKIQQINTLSPDEIAEEMEKVDRNEKTHFEFKHRLANGIIRDVEVFSSKIEIKGKEFLHSIIHDITEKKKVEKQIILMSRSIEQSPVVITITNSTGDIQYVNPKFTEITGYTSEEVIGKNIRLIKSGKHSKEFYKDLWSTILSGKNWSGEINNKKKSGELYWENVIISPIIDSRGTITHFIAVKEDITEKKKMIEDLILAKEKAEEMNKIKSNFFANMSHELRTPLNGILGFSSLLEEELADKPDLVTMADAIHRSGNRLLDTLNLILNISKLEAEKIDIKLKEYNIIPLISESINLFIPSAARKNLQLLLVNEKNEYRCIIDEGLFTGIINNLINNAIKYTDEGNVLIKVCSKNNKVVIEVIDTGIGIPEDKQKVIWEEFRQVSEGINRNFEGTGLGLTIAKKYTELLKGTISVKSKIGYGSTFTLELPLSENRESQPGISTSFTTDKVKIEEVMSRNKILYVEDDFDTIKIVSLLLKGFCQLDTAPGADTALEKIKENNYDAVLMDINLGRGIDGVQLTKLIREIPGYKDKPVIAITAFAMEGDKEVFLSKGLTHYISKPFTREEILTLLDSILNKP